MHQRVLILGNSGSGKTTRAKAYLAQGLAHLDLDTVAWAAGHAEPTRAPLAESAAAIDRFVADNPRWVVEGCYADLMTHLRDRADHLVFLDVTVETCVAHCRARPHEPHKYETAAAQDAMLEGLLAWVRAYSTREGPLGRADHLAFYESFPASKERLTDA